MEIKRVVAAWFSPTGNVRRLTMAMAEVCSARWGVPLEELDFTRPEAREKTWHFSGSDFLVIGLPVYAGRLPNKILPFVQEGLRGEGTLSLPLVAYGNRAFDDALSELVYEQKNTGFVPLAAGAFTTQHAFATALAAGRPDESDLDEAVRLAEQVCERAAALTSRDEVREQLVPGNTPPGPYYRPKRTDGENAVFLKAKPKTDKALCDGCGVCAQVCPMGSIDPKDCTQVTGICIKCHACVTHCHRWAKYFDDPDLLSHREMLEQHYMERKENRTWLF